MLVYFIYNNDENNNEYSFYAMDASKAAAEQTYKTSSLKEFLYYSRSDIEYFKMTEIDVSDGDYAIMSGVDEDCYFSDEDFTDFVREIDDDPKSKVIYECSGDQAGMQLHQYWIDNQAKYPNTPEGAIEAEDYFDFIESFSTEAEAAYLRLVDDFIKSGKFKATV